MTKRVRFFGDWDNDSAGILERLAAQTKGLENNRYNDMIFVTDESYDHAVVFNFPMHELRSPPENNISFILEPPELSKLMHRQQRANPSNQVRKVYSFVNDPPYETVYGLGFTTVNQRVEPTSGDRGKICMIVSDKRMTPFHLKRHQVKEALLNTDLPIDFYGRGLTGADQRIKGEIPPMSKDSVLLHYEFCIDFENSTNAITDKYFDPIFCGTVPVTNSPIANELSPNSSEFIDFNQPVEVIVGKIRDVIETKVAKDYNLQTAKKEITEGNMCLVKWIEGVL